jgi:hypothetical protein
MMKCEDVLTALQAAPPGNELARRAASEHLSGCEDCRSAAHALAVLRADRDLLIDPPTDDALRRAVIAAVAPRDRERPQRATFWLGVSVGVALAASIAAAVVMLRPVADSVVRGVPAVTLALNEVRNVDVALTSPEPLASAEIHVTLTGEIGLDGFEDQRELRWTTDLDRGVNQLTLPIVARGTHGGQVLVEVQHGDKRRAFVVDVRAVGAPSASARQHGRALVVDARPIDFSLERPARNQRDAV